MSLFGSMKTAVSGMNAQANRLSTVGDNIANVNTTAYKRASTSFSSFVLPSTSGNYNSGSVNTSVQYAVSEQGALTSTSSVTDLAIQGDGFFVVQDSSGAPYLTRVGSFSIDDNGSLVNAAGFTLLGYPASNGSASDVNSLSQLEPINLNFYELSAVPTTSGSVTMNLPLDEPAVGTAIAGTPPSENGTYSGYTAKFTISTLDTTGGTAENSYIDVYFTKLDDNQWEVTAFGGIGGTSGSFPYDLSDPENMATTTITFDPATGAITSGGSTLTLWASSAPFTLDLSALTQSSTPSTGSVSLKYAANLPTEAPILDTGAGELPPSSNDPDSVVQVHQKLTGYTGLGSSMTLDLYATRTGTNEWEVAIYDSADATAGGFPYSTPALATATLTFDPATGALIGPTSISSTLDNGDVVELDMSGVISVSMYDPADAIASASLSFNLSPSASIVEPYVLGATPADNLSTSSYSYKSSLTAYDNAGSQVTLDVYYTKGDDNVWEVAVFNKADESILGGFPYASGPLATTLH